MTAIEVSQIQSALESNQLYPTKREIKTMIKNNQWDTLGRIFRFTPEFLNGAGTSICIDWRSVPKSMSDILLYTLGSEPLPRKKPTSKWKSSKTSKFRAESYGTQDGICWYCKKATLFKDWSVDHRTPLSRGGTSKLDNMAGCCKPCNNAKGNLTESEFAKTVMRVKEDGRVVFDRVMGKAMQKAIRANA